MKKQTAILLIALSVLLICFVSFAATGENYDPNGPIVVSLGDSYSSGEGIPPFYGQNDSFKNEDWLAHRSEQSWAGRLKVPGLSGTLSDHRGTYFDGVLTEGNWYFVASSGATTKHLYKTQAKSYNKLVSFGMSLINTFGGKDLAPQLEIFDALKRQGKSVDYVTITIGGNDVGFSSVITDAALGEIRGNADLHQRIEDTWEAFENSIKYDIKNAYYNIYKAAGDQVTIIVAGYPRLINPDGYGILYNREDAVYVNEQVTEFNKRLSEIVDECRNEYKMKIYFAPVEESFGDRGAYADNELINPILIPAREQDLNYLAPYSDYSFHPNSAGAQVYANCVQAVIDKMGKTSDSAVQPVFSCDCQFTDSKTGGGSKFFYVRTGPTYLNGIMFTMSTGLLVSNASDIHQSSDVYGAYELKVSYKSGDDWILETPANTDMYCSNSYHYYFSRPNTVYKVQVYFWNATTTAKSYIKNRKIDSYFTANESYWLSFPNCVATNYVDCTLYESCPE